MKKALGVFLLGLSLGTGLALASEHGRSTYSPGTVGDFSMAVLPEAKGFYLRTELWTYSGRNAYEELGGALDVEADLDAWVCIPRVTWVSGWTFLGARHGVNLSLPLVNVESDARVTRQCPGQAASTEHVQGDRLGFSDFYLAPSVLEWKLGAWNLMWLETVVIPSGSYDSDESVNVSRNYLALNSSLAATWRHPKGGPEVDARASYIVNAENPATDYRTGDELTLDAVAAWRLDARWSLGVAGYAYQQLTGDSGAGAVLGDFKGQSWGAGPVVRYIGAAGSRRVAWVAKWLHDFDATRRYEGDMLFLAATLRL